MDALGGELGMHGYHFTTVEQCGLGKYMNTEHPYQDEALGGKKSLLWEMEQLLGVRAGDDKAATARKFVWDTISVEFAHLAGQGGKHGHGHVVNVFLPKNRALTELHCKTFFAIEGPIVYNALKGRDDIGLNVHFIDYLGGRADLGSFMVYPRPDELKLPGGDSGSAYAQTYIMWSSDKTVFERLFTERKIIGRGDHSSYGLLDAISGQLEDTENFCMRWDLLQGCGKNPPSSTPSLWPSPP